MTDAVPPGDATDAALLVGEDPLKLMMEAGRPLIIEPEDLAEIPQVPYAKTPRVPEIGQELESHVCDELAAATGDDCTPGMLRLERGRAVGDPEKPAGFVGLFAVLYREGGLVRGYLAAYEADGGELDGEPVRRVAVGPVGAYAEALALYEDEGWLEP